MAARKTAHVTEVPAPRSTRIITCANHKGGTGKTTTAVNVSAGLAVLKKQRVLLCVFHGFLPLSPEECCHVIHGNVAM
jgi:Mrp family chromosome partitioning ATPase